MNRKIIKISLIALLLSGCSGGGSGSSSTGDTAEKNPPVASTPSTGDGTPPATEDPSNGGDTSIAPEQVKLIALSFEAIKKFRFAWIDAENASHYHLLENPDGVSGFRRVAEYIPQGNESLTLKLETALYSRTNAQYILQACNGEGSQERCSDSTILSVDDFLLTGSIGYFKASNTDAHDDFGKAISLSADGQTLAIGAPREDSNTTGVNGDESNNDADESGAVYIFTRSESGWQQQAYLKANNNRKWEYFGSELSLNADGQTLAVGTDSGVYIFTRNEDDWQQQAYLKASDTDASENFGDSLSFSSDGQTLAVGASREDSGAVYIFTRDKGTWQQQAYIKASNSDENDLFGYTVGLSADGQILGVGAPNENSSATGINNDQSNNRTYNSGAVYIFARSDTDWQQQAYIKASNTDEGDYFGSSLSLSADGKVLAIGATAESSNASGINGDANNNQATGAGAAYIFIRNNDTWQQQAYIKASNTNSYDRFGGSLSLSADGQSLAVGAIREGSSAIGINGDEGDNSADWSGAVYIFARSEDNWQQKAYLKASNTEKGDYFGFGNISLSADGQTLAVGAFKEDSGATGIGGNQQDNSAYSSGAVYIY